MNKSQVNRYFCIAGMAISIVLIVFDLVEKAAFRTEILLSHTGLLLFCTYFLFLNLRSERKRKEAFNSPQNKACQVPRNAGTVEIIKRPKGLMVFAVLQLISLLSSIMNLFEQNRQFISYGMVISGTAYKTISLLHILVGCAIAIGILKVKRWAYQGYFYLSGYYIASFFANIMLVDDKLLLSAGWSFKNSMVTGYRIMMLAGILFVFGLCLWLYKYRRLFNSTGSANW